MPDVAPMTITFLMSGQEIIVLFHFQTGSPQQLHGFQAFLLRQIDISLRDSFWIRVMFNRFGNALFRQVQHGVNETVGIIGRIIFHLSLSKQ